MNKRIGFFVLAAGVVHVSLALLLPSKILMAAAILGIDALVALLVFFSKDSISVPPPPDQIVIVPDSSGIVENQDLQGLREDLLRTQGLADKQQTLLHSCATFFDELLIQNTKLAESKEMMVGLRTSLTTLNQHNENIQQNAVQVSAVAGNLVGTTEQGFNMSRNVQENVMKLAENIAGALAETNSLMEESKKISDILTIMSEIAVMTKVLSINASIVAARAGIKGKEFDVVAKEVRKLSVSTEDSLSNISALITDIQNKVLGVSTKLQSVSSGIMNDKEAMLSVAGTLQGVTLAVEIIRSITDVSGEKATEGQQGVTDTLTLVDKAMQQFTIENTEETIHTLQAKISDLIKLN